MKRGLAQDMRETLGTTFVKDNRVVVPGALLAYDGFGGDLIQTTLGASASAERVLDAPLGGPFSAQIGGEPTGRELQKRGFTAAKGLFDAMASAKETVSSTEDEWVQGSTTTIRSSNGGRFSCQVRTRGGVVLDSSCAFGDLLVVRTVSWPAASGFCVK